MKVTYALVDVVPDAVGDGVKDHLGGEGRDKDSGQEDGVALDDGVVAEAGELVGGRAVVGLNGHGDVMYGGEDGGRTIEISDVRI